MSPPEKSKVKGRIARILDRVLWLGVAAIVIVALWPREKGPIEGKAAPALNVALLNVAQLNTAQLNTAQLNTARRFTREGPREKPLLIEAFASWCGACKRNKGLLNSFEGSSLSERLETLAISVDTSLPAAQQAQASWPILGQVAFDDTGAFNRDYSIEMLPTYILIGKDGKVLRSHAGGLRPAQLESWIDLIDAE